MAKGRSGCRVCVTEWWQATSRKAVAVTVLPTACYLLLATCFWRGSVQATALGQAPIVSPAAVSTPVPSPPVNHGEVVAQTYIVKPGDTLWRVALEVGLDLALMPCMVAPDFSPEQPLVIGNALTLLLPEEWCHQIAIGDTLATIAEQYQVTPAAIYALPWNQLQGVPLAAVVLAPGHYLRVPLAPIRTAPNAESSTPPVDSTSFLTWMLHQPVNTSPFAVLAVGGPFAEEMRKQRTQGTGNGRALRPLGQPGAVPANWPYGSGVFTWPLSGWLTQGYRYDHRALDIAAPTGTLVTAADRGVVIRAGWNNQGYGLFVIIDHNIDYVTLYAHLSELLVKEGQVVGQGEVIGKVGSTGNSTGPHLHFEIRDFGRLTNPLELLVH